MPLPWRRPPGVHEPVHGKHIVTIGHPVFHFDDGTSPLQSNNQHPPGADIFLFKFISTRDIQLNRVMSWLCEQFHMSYTFTRLYKFIQPTWHQTYNYTNSVISLSKDLQINNNLQWYLFLHIVCLQSHLILPIPLVRPHSLGNKDFIVVADEISEPRSGSRCDALESPWICDTHLYISNLRLNLITESNTNLE